MSKFRNLAIIAHVDHGKTTLVDELLKAGGTYRENQAVTERAMDSMDLEREKGITIKSKNTAVHWKDKIINIVDTPGHADFGGEVERVMKMVDGVILVVDAFGGPQAQTRFVLRKALQEGLKPIIVVNKIDRPNSDPLAVHEKVLELFLELDATEDQFDAPTLYGSAKNGYFSASHLATEGDCVPLIEAIIEHIPAPVVDQSAPLKMLVSNIDWDDYVGRIAIGKILAGTIKKGDTVFRFLKDGTKVRTKIGKVFEYTNMGIQETKTELLETLSASLASKMPISAKLLQATKMPKHFLPSTSTPLPSRCSSPSMMDRSLEEMESTFSLAPSVIVSFAR